jgi:hypothetical protein
MHACTHACMRACVCTPVTTNTCAHMTPSSGAPHVACVCVCAGEAVDTCAAGAATPGVMRPRLLRVLWPRVHGRVRAVPRVGVRLRLPLPSAGRPPGQGAPQISFCHLLSIHVSAPLRSPPSRALMLLMLSMASMRRKGPECTPSCLAWLSCNCHMTLSGLWIFRLAPSGRRAKLLYAVLVAQCMLAWWLSQRNLQCDRLPASVVAVRMHDAVVTWLQGWCLTQPASTISHGGMQMNTLTAGHTCRFATGGHRRQRSRWCS